MESIILGSYLFVVLLSAFCWLITPVKKAQEATNIETPVLQEITTQEVVINESLVDLKTEEITTEDTPVVQEIKEILVDNNPRKELQNENLETEEPSEKPSGIDLKDIRTYLLHKHRCVKTKDLPSSFQLPQDIKQYNLRGEKVVRLTALEALIVI